MLDLFDDVPCLQSFRQDIDELCVAYRKVTREWPDIFCLIMEIIWNVEVWWGW